MEESNKRKREEYPMPEGGWVPEDEEDEDEVCQGCFKRKVVGAADVYNAKSRLVTGLKMQRKYLDKYVDQEKKPKTYETRKKLEAFFVGCLEEFDTIFESQLAEFADLEEINRCKKRKRQ